MLDENANTCEGCGRYAQFTCECGVHLCGNCIKDCPFCGEEKDDDPEFSLEDLADAANGD